MTKTKLEDFYFNYNEELFDLEEKFQDLFTANKKVTKVFDSLVEEINEWLNEHKVFALDGTVNLWNSQNSINKIIVLHNFQAFLGKLKDTENIILSYDSKTDTLEVQNIHHDGTNIYKIKPLDKLTKSELKDILESQPHFDKSISKTYFDKYYSQLRKDEIIEILRSEYGENLE